MQTNLLGESPCWGVPDVWDGHAEGTLGFIGEVVVFDMKMLKGMVTHEKIKVVDERAGKAEEGTKLALHVVDGRMMVGI